MDIEMKCTKDLPFENVDNIEPGIIVNAKTADMELSQEITVESENSDQTRRLVRKIDVYLLICMFGTISLTFIDKVILSSASVFGLPEDTHLNGDEYSWLGSIFYIGWLVWEYPTSVLIQRFPVGKYVASITFIWGVIVAVTAASTNFAGLATCRFLIGMAEATISPAFILITSTWYTRSEVSLRISIWSSGSSIGSIVASLCAYGIGQITHPLRAWQWLYIIFGVFTILWSVILFIFLPDTIDNSIFLSVGEKRYAEDRVVRAGTGKISANNRKYDFAQVRECLKDPKTFFSASIALLTMIPNGGTGTFGNLALKSFGFSGLQTTLVNIPVGVIAFLSINITGWLASRDESLALFMLIVTVIPPVIGCALISHVDNKGVRLFGYYCVQTGPGALPHVLSLIGANFKGVTKKMTMSAIVYISYCVGNIIGPLTFLSSEAARGYPTGFNGIISCYALTIFFSLLYRCYLKWMNKKTRQKMESQGQERVTGTDVALTEEDYKDTTDWNTPGFIYRM
ncbi:hypothetical protein F1880_008476 [Penicillium rolfsii]|nr:hypothetical protein F1880_008476 [Penicillium rolfsii]